MMDLKPGRPNLRWKLKICNMKVENTKYLALSTASLSQKKKNKSPDSCAVGTKEIWKTVVVEETCFFLNTVSRAATDLQR